MQVTLTQAADLIVACPDVHFCLMGEPGIGKSSLMSLIGQRTGLPTVYLDCASLELGDVGVPMPQHETRTTEWYLNAMFKLHEGKPVAIMLDEFSKAPPSTHNMLHPLLEDHNPRLGNVPLPKGSIVFLTGNLESDGVGDAMLAHTKMRVCLLEVAKPDAQSWLLWAAENGIDPIIMAWVDRHPHALSSYRDGGQDGNPFIFNPSAVQGAVVTNRTLKKASDIVRQRTQFDRDALQAALTGQVGASAAASIDAFIKYNDALPAWRDVLENPKTAAIPDSQGAMAVLVYGAVERVKSKADITAVLEYFQRVDSEWQCIFCLQLAKSTSKRDVACTCAAFTAWVAKNEDLL